MGAYHHASGLFGRASAKIAPGDVYDAFALSLLVGQPLPAEDRRLADFEAGWLRNHFVVVFLPLLRRQVEKYLERPDRYDPDQMGWLATAPDADTDELARMFGTATFRSERHRSEHPDDVHNDRWAEIAATVGRLSRASGVGDVALALAGQGGLLNLVHNTGTSVLDKLPDWHGLWKALEACASGTPAQVYAGASPDARRLLRLALPRTELPGATAGAAAAPPRVAGLDPLRTYSLPPQGVLAKAAWAARRRAASELSEDNATPVHIALKVLPSGKGRPAGDQVFDCVKCGACCACGWAVDLTGGETKRFLADPKLRGMVRLNQGIDQWESGEDDEPGFMKEVNVKGFGSQCAALSGKVGRHAPCSIYEKRPRVCRNFKPGSDRCLEARAIHGIDGRHRRRKGNATSGHAPARMTTGGRAAYHAASELLPGEARLSLECRCADDFGAGYKDESALTGEDREHIENYEETRQAQLAMSEEAASLGLEVSVSDSDDRHSRHSDAYVYFPVSRMGEVAAMLGAVGLDGDILDVPADFPEAEAERVRSEYGWSVERKYVSPGERGA
jgi:Fe-S-cluster containining protein